MKKPSQKNNKTNKISFPPKKDIALHLREQTKRTDLPDDVIRTLADAYYEITRLEEENEELESLLDDYRREAMDQSRHEGFIED